jgi:hypothetical protein
MSLPIGTTPVIMVSLAEILPYAAAVLAVVAVRANCCNYNTCKRRSVLMFWSLADSSDIVRGATGKACNYFKEGTGLRRGGLF